MPSFRFFSTAKSDEAAKKDYHVSPSRGDFEVAALSAGRWAGKEGLR